MTTELSLSDFWMIISGFLLRLFKDSSSFLLIFSSSTLCLNHKQLSTIQGILSVIGTPTYNIAKFLVPTNYLNPQLPRITRSKTRLSFHVTFWAKMSIYSWQFLMLIFSSVTNFGWDNQHHHIKIALWEWNCS